MKTLILLLYVYIFCHNSTYTQAMNTRLLLTLDTFAVGAMATKLLESAIDIRWLSTWVYTRLPN
jgi:hypothetical protein